MAATEVKATAQIIDETLSKRKRFLHWLLSQIWYVHPTAYLHLRVEPAQAYRLLAIAAKPSATRLELRNLFKQGRRYFLQTTGQQGFRMMTTHKIRWRMRRRTRATAMLYGDFEALDEETVRLTVHSHIRLWYLLDVFLWPSFITSIIIYMWWPVWLITLLIGALYILSWLAHRFNAALETHEMIFFIESILQDYFPPSPQELMASGKADIVYGEAFAEAWEQYVGKVSED